MAELRVPLFDLSLSTTEIAAASAALREGWLTMGPRTRAFEAAFAAAVGVAEAVAVSSGTAALHLALVAAGIGAGAEVLCPTLTFVATANAVRYVGARPVFCEVVGSDDLNLDVDDLIARITPRTRAVLAVHYAGYPADLPRLAQLCRDRALVLIEDAAHACISRVDGRACGAWGLLGCFSFYSNKNMTCGEGGAVTTDDTELAAMLRSLRSHGLSSSTLERHHGAALSYDVRGLGYNYRLDEMRAGLLTAQLEALGPRLEARARLVTRYGEALAGVSVTIPSFGPGEVAHHIFPILLPPGTDRPRLRAAMRGRGVQTSVHYPPVHLLSAFAAHAPAPGLPRTEALAARQLTLPLFPTMSEAQQDCVVEVLAEELAELDGGPR